MKSTAGAGLDLHVLRQRIARNARSDPWRGGVASTPLTAAHFVGRASMSALVVRVSVPTGQVSGTSGKRITPA